MWRVAWKRQKVHSKNWTATSLSKYNPAATHEHQQSPICKRFHLKPLWLLKYAASFNQQIANKFPYWNCNKRSLSAMSRHHSSFTLVCSYCSRRRSSSSRWSRAQIKIRGCSWATAGPYPERDALFENYILAALRPHKYRLAFYQVELQRISRKL